MAQSKIHKALTLALIVHACAAVFGLLHWWLVWQQCVIKDAHDSCEGADDAPYTYALLFSVIAFVGAICVNLFRDKKREEAKLTSIVAIVAAVLGFYYIIGWWAGDYGEALRK